MRHPDPNDEDVRALLRDARQLEPQPPAFHDLWRQANRQRMSSLHRGIQPRRILLATVGAALILSLAWTWFSKVQSLRQAAEVDALLASLHVVEATPLDFLLDIPGAELMYQIPRFGRTPQPIDLSQFELQEP